jgi:uncharacterized repeat protein (TIGR01451 family)
VILFFVLFLSQATLTFAQETNVVALDSGSDHSVALRADGTVWTWGYNANGQLGDGGFINSNVPTRVAMLRNIVSISAGGWHTLAVREDGTVWAWGLNYNGQLGDATTINQAVPVRVKDPSDATGFLTNVVAVAAGERHSLALKANGTVWAWGYNGNGRLGDSTYDNRSSPVQVKDTSDASGFLTGVKAIAAGAAHSIALKNNKTVWTWGNRDYAQIGRIISGAGSKPQNVAGQVAGLTDVKGIAGGWEHTVVLKEDGTVWTCGRNLEGQLGDGTTIGSFFPPPEPPKFFVQVIDPTGESDPTGYLTGIAAIDADDRHTVAVNENGSVYGWGWNYGGKLCHDILDNKLRPIRMDGLADIYTPSAGANFNLLLKQEGTIWGCGYNSWGQIGTGEFSDHTSTPQQTKFPSVSLVYIYGLDYISPGEEGTFMIEYENAFGFILENAVVVFDLPGDFTYSSSTNGGIYRDDKNQVFWKLGDLAPGAKGQLYVKLNVPWGMPLHSRFNLLANITAVNLPGNLNVNDYLTYGTIQLVENRTLTSAEITTLRNQDPALESLLTHAKNLGLSFYNVAQKVAFSDGTSFVRLVLLDLADFAPAFLYKKGGRAFIEKVQKDKLTLFDLAGGMTVNRNDGSIEPWGTWAASHSLTFFHCVFNCAVEGIPSYLLGKYIKVIELATDSMDCVQCSLTKDPDVCLKCSHSLNDMGWESFKEYVDALKCVNDCYDDPNSHVCTKEKKECDPNGLWRWFSTTVFEEDVVYVTRCNTTLGGIYGATVAIQCAIGEVCNGGECKEPGAVCQPPNCTAKEAEIRTAHDPNIKFADVKGDVLPGQTIHYSVECENLGSGTAYGVFILDELDANLNEATLSIDNSGSYIPTGRLLSWDIGTLAPRETRTVTFSVDVKSGLAEGTQITNKADVYFPSANEITPTNPVVHVVRALTANPQTVTTTSGKSTPIVLTGNGSGQLSFAVTTAPLYGTLTGTPPSVNYQSMNEFFGQDKLSFAVTNGSLSSIPAQVLINVDMNPTDTTPPVVVGTLPADGETTVQAITTPILENPIRYGPAITATFSEGLDPATVTTTTVQVPGVSGAVSYDEQGKTVVFMPLAPLTAATTYSPRLTTDLKDKKGNAMSQAYTWHFTMAPLARILTTPYPTLQGAYDDAAGIKPVIMLKDGDSSSILGALNADENKSVTIKGGYNAAYNLIIGGTSISGPLTIRSGAVIIDNVVVK